MLERPVLWALCNLMHMQIEMGRVTTQSIQQNTGYFSSGIIMESLFTLMHMQSEKGRGAGR
jgi:hypothetical protein